MSKDEKISIIVPIYNVQHNLLNNCINSLINQTYKNVEIILVDDGSTDDSGKICDDFALNDKRIRVIHQKNKGLSGARNTGVNHVTTNWYTFVDGDDILLSSGIEQLAKSIEKNVDVICTRVIQASKTELIDNYPYEFNKIYSSEEDLHYLKCMLLNFYGNNCSSCGKLYSKLFTDKYHLYHNENLKQGAEDLEFNFRVFSNAKKIKIIESTFYQCVYNCKSITRSFNKENEYLKMDCFKAIRQNINLKDKDLCDWFYNRMQYAIVSSAISGFFNPSNKQSYNIQKKEFIEFLKIDIIQDALKYQNSISIDKKRKFIILLIKNKFFLVVKIISILRFYQKRQIKKEAI